MSLQSLSDEQLDALIAQKQAAPTSPSAQDPKLTAYLDERKDLSYGEHVKKNAQDTLSKVMASLMGAEEGVASTGRGIRQLMGFDEKNLAPSWVKDSIRNYDNTQPQRYEQARNEYPGWALGGNIAGSAASLPIPGLGQARVASALLPNSPAMAKFAGNVLRGTTDSAMAGGIQAVPEGQSRTDNAFSSAAFGAGLSGLLGVPGLAKGGMDSFKNYFLSSTLPPEQLAKNLKAAKGTETGLGRIIENPDLMKLQENVLADMPLSGANATRQRMAAQIDKKGKQLFSDITGGVVPEKQKIGVTLQQGLKQVEKDLNALKRENYAKVDTLAESTNTNIGREHFSDKAREKLLQIKRSSELLAEFPNDVIVKLDKYIDPHSKFSLKDTNIFRSLLGDEAQKAYKAGNKHLGGIYSDLKKSLDVDIDDAISTGSSKELKSAYKDAQNFYKNEIAPLEASEITKFTRKGMDPDTLVNTFFKGGNNDRSILLNKLVSTLSKSDNSQELLNNLKYGIFSNALEEGGQINPAKLSTIYKKMGNEQKNVLFSPEDQKKIKEYATLTGMNDDAVNLMLNPKTGARGGLRESIKNMSIGAGGGATLGGMIGGPPAAMVGGAAGLALGSGIGAGKWVNKYLTDEKKREKVVQALMNPNKTKSDDKVLAELRRALVRGSAGVSAQTNSQNQSEGNY